MKHLYLLIIKLSILYNKNIIIKKIILIFIMDDDATRGCKLAVDEKSDDKR